MDMSCIKRKLDTGAYTDPWEFVNDVFLMFENAWVYNRKTSRVYRYCSKVRKFLPVYSWPFFRLYYGSPQSQNSRLHHLFVHIFQYQIVLPR